MSICCVSAPFRASVTLSSIRLFETAYLQGEQNLVDGGAMERLGWRNFLESTFFRRMWPEVRAMVSKPSAPN